MRIKKPNNFFLILILGSLNTITPFSIDMYLPAFPKIAADLNTSIQNVALSVSTYFLGFAIGQILYGPLLDRFGRKPPLYAGLILYIIATLFCATSSSIEFLLILRFIQALGGCVGSVAAMAMVRDFFPPQKSASVISLLVLVLSASPLLAPTIGSFVVVTLSWHYVFILLAIIAAIIFIIVIFFLPEGQQKNTSISLKPKPIINSFKQILITPQFYVFSLAGSFSFAGLFIYVAGSPAIFMNEFSLSAKAYGGVFALLSVGMIGGSQLNHILTKRFANDKILRFVWIIQVITSTIYAVGVINNLTGLYANIFFLFIILACAGISYPNAAAIALAPFAKNAGTASALLGCLQIGIGGIISSIVGLLHYPGSFSTSITIALSSAVAVIIYWSGKKQVTNLQTSEAYMHTSV